MTFTQLRSAHTHFGTQKQLTVKSKTSGLEKNGIFSWKYPLIIDFLGDETLKKIILTLP